MIIKILIALVMICVIILVHEFGHYIVGRANGIVAKEFFIGVGPTLWKKQKGETLYSIKAIPFGGACVFGNEEDIEHPEQSSYFNANVYSRIATILAGPVFNFLLAFVLSLFVIGATGYTPTRIAEVTKGSPAEAAGIQAGDLITRFNGSKVYMFGEISYATMYNNEEPIKVELLRGNEKIYTSVTPKYDEEYGRMMMGITFAGTTEKPTPIETLKYSYANVRYWIKISISSIKMLFTGTVSPKELSGPVGVTMAVSEVYDEASNYGIMAIIYTMLDFAILITANLGVMNLIPFPALDGGKLVFLIIEAVTRKPVNREVEGIISFIGVVLLFVLMAFVLFNDVQRIFVR